jgi:hypothetical protein
MTINFKRLRLQMHFRQLYEALGAMDAELLIADAFQRELARNLAMPQHQGASDRIGGAAGTPNGETRDSISKQKIL